MHLASIDHCDHYMMDIPLYQHRQRVVSRRLLSLTSVPWFPFFSKCSQAFQPIFGFQHLIIAIFFQNQRRCYISLDTLVNSSFSHLYCHRALLKKIMWLNIIQQQPSLISKVKFSTKKNDCFVLEKYFQIKVFSTTTMLNHT